MTTLRPYQRAAIDALIAYWREGGGNPLVEMATGTGKSVVIATLVRELIEHFDPNMRIVMLVHVRELVAQNAAALLRTWPGAPVGINSASLGRRDRHAQILFASIQSVFRSAHELGPRSLVLIDEAHLVPRDGEGMYRRFLTDLRERDPDMRVAGFTATPYRLDSGRLDEGEDDERLFDRVVYRYGIGEGIRDQFLSPLTSKATTTAIDVSGVARRGGEFIAGALEDAVDKDWITKAAVEEIVAFGANRRSWLAFCAGVRHAEHVRDAIRAHGITCETVTGDTPTPDRDRIIAAFKSGAIRCLTNANVLTTGFDAPAVDLIAMLRPTLSTGLYVQIVGRGTRIAPDKRDCIAEGQRVLTDQGLVPIERVTTAMKVWDGVEFVAHCGTVFRGEREVIRYAGLEATPDHRVWTEAGWKTLGQCALEQASVAVTGDGREPVWKTEGRFRRDHQKKRGREASYSSGMHWLRRALSQRLHELNQGLRRLSLLLKPPAGAEMAGHSGDCCEAALHKPEGHSIRALWGARHPVRIRVSDRDGGMGAEEFGAAPRNGVGPDRQRRALRAGQPAISHPTAKPVEQARFAGDVEAARVQSGLPGRAVFRQHFAEPLGVRNDAARGGRTLPEAVGKTKRRVWDILNAGPRHSFTVEGLLVHNCLVLDFAGNVRRHGPVDQIEVGGSGGEAKAAVDRVMAKECPACRELLPIAVRACTACGHEFPAPEKPKHEARADATAAILSTSAPAWIEVYDWSARRHEKEGGRPSMRVEYRCGMVWHKEWICFEHSGLARSKAEAWWRRMGAQAPIPSTIDEALARFRECRKPEAIAVRPEGKFYAIVAHRHEQLRGAA